MPPYWALGFQLSRYGYNSLDNMKAAIQRLRDNNIPQVSINNKLNIELITLSTEALVQIGSTEFRLSD